MDKSRIKVDILGKSLSKVCSGVGEGIGNNAAKTFEAKNLWPKPLTVSWESK